MSIPALIDEKLAALRRRLEECRDGGLVLAYSGGVDSAFLLKIACDVLGDRVVALTAVGASLAPGELDAARAVARQVGAVHEERASTEAQRPGYVANGPDRCYHCKTTLYDLAVDVARERGFRWIASGTHADELKDYRPGLKAASEHGVLHPLAEAGMVKDDIRVLSQRFGLPTWDKPQTPCLASRLPYGTTVTPERLAQVARAEQACRDAGLRIFRVRHHDSIARLEVSAQEWPLLSDPALRERLHRDLQAAGYTFVALDLEPFRSGRLNEAAGLVSLGHRGAPGT